MIEFTRAGIEVGFFVPELLSVVIGLYVFGRLGKIAALFDWA